MLVPSKGRLEGAVAAPVVPRGCCVAGLAPAHTAAVWLSVCEAGITGRPFTPAQPAICSPSPSVLAHSASSLLHHSILCLQPSLAVPPAAYMPHCSAKLCPLHPQICPLLTSSPTCFFYCTLYHHPFYFQGGGGLSTPTETQT